MQAWMNSSPYYVFNVYLPGSLNGHKDNNLTPVWVSAVQTQGWGLIPTWVGLQSPCACAKTVKGVCTPYAHVFSSDPSTDGANEADQAITASKNLGLVTTILYKDIENYTPSTSCSPAVQAFVDGWDSELHLQGYLAGVYANPAPINSDISQISTIPDDIWITKTSAATKPQVTIWNQGISDSLWPNKQRIHQFLIDQAAVNFGGVPLSIDDDIIDAQIVPGVNGTKNSSSVYSDISCPGALTTYPIAINDMNGTAFINGSTNTDGSAQTGTIVGQYQDATTYLTHAYRYSGGICSVIDYSDAVVTWPSGINNVGQVVGHYEDSAAKMHGFLLTGSKFSTIDYSGASATYLSSINDAGQIDGYANVPNLGFQHFLYYAGTFYPINYNAGINGDATVVGQAVCGNTDCSYEEYLAPPSWTGPNTAVPQGPGYNLFAVGIDNDNDIVGGLEEAGDCSYSCGFLFPPGSAAITIFQYPGSNETEVYSIDDFGQIVGSYSVPNSGDVHGFMVAPPQ